MLQYDFISQNCGYCTEVTPQVVSCSEFRVSPIGITCTFTVSSTVCGNITGPESMQSVNIDLKGEQGSMFINGFVSCTVMTYPQSPPPDPSALITIMLNTTETVNGLLQLL